MTSEIICIVEGHGEIEAVPILVRRIFEVLDPGFTRIKTPKPFRISKKKLLQPGELERAVDLAARKITGPGAIFILLDSDEDCPAEIGPEIVRRAQTSRSDRMISVVFAKREYESWFLAAAESLREQRGLRREIHSHPDPESVHGAKEWLNNNMTPGRTYSPTIDQPALTALFNVQTARSASSFDKCFRELEKIFNRLKSASST